MRAKITWDWSQFNIFCNCFRLPCDAD